VQLLRYVSLQLHYRTYWFVHSARVLVLTSDCNAVQVASALSDEIRRLAALVDEFERPFHPDPLVLNTYKKVSLFI